LPYACAICPTSFAQGSIPRIGTPLNWRLLIGDYTNAGVPSSKLKEWAYLDTFDMLAPKYDSPQTLETVRGWFDAAKLVEVDVRHGYNDIQGRGTRHGAEIAAPLAGTFG